jgi:hypothetical protein
VGECQRERGPASLHTDVALLTSSRACGVGGFARSLAVGAPGRIDIHRVSRGIEGTHFTAPLITSLRVEWSVLHSLTARREFIDEIWAGQ